MPTPSYAERLGVVHRLTQPALRSAIRDLPIAAGDRVLDVGCGIGRHSLWLAEAVGPSGEVIGLDLSSEHLSVAGRLLRENPPVSRAAFVAGNLHNLPFADGSFDWVWCVDTLWPAFLADEPVAVVSELARVLKCGGHLALVYWSSQSLLCGHPALEARLSQGFVSTTRYLNGLPPKHQFMRALGWFAGAGVNAVEVRTHVADICGPLTPEQQEAAAVCCTMLWGDLEPHLSVEDSAEFRRLTNIEADTCIFARSDYYGFITYTCFHGRVRT